MAKFDFERECRTPSSECYTVLEDDNNIGRLDIHFADAIAHATLSVSESLTTEGIQELIDSIDEEILDAIKGLSVLDLSDLVKSLEEEFGVSAAAPVAMATVQGVAGTAEAAQAEEEQIG